MTAPEVELRRVWHRVVGGGHDHHLDSVLARHREPHRHYHTATHVVRVCRHVDLIAAAHPVPDTDAVLAAAVYHDAVYDTTAAHGHNERASAALAAQVLHDVGWTASRCAEVERLIGLTVGHPVADGFADHDPAGAVLVDADLAILGADPADYSAYVTGVRAEYGHVGDEAWRTGRAAVLLGFLDRSAIYATTTMRAERESRARANLTAELASLGAIG